MMLNSQLTSLIPNPVLIAYRDVQETQRAAFFVEVVRLISDIQNQQLDDSRVMVLVSLNELKHARDVIMAHLLLTEAMARDGDTYLLVVQEEL